MLGKTSWTYLVLGKSSWTCLVLLSYGRSSTGPHLVGVKSISFYIRLMYMYPGLHWACTLLSVLWEGAVPILTCFSPWH